MIESGRSAPGDAAAQPRARRAPAWDGAEPSLDRHFAERYRQPVPRAEEETIIWLLHDTARLWRKRYNRAVRAEMPGMTCARCAVLVQLAQRGGTNQATLAQRLAIRPIALVRHPLYALFLPVPKAEDVVGVTWRTDLTPR